MIYNRAEFDKEAKEIKNQLDVLGADIAEMKRKDAVSAYLRADLIKKYEELIAIVDGSAEPKQFKKEWWE